MKLEFRLSGEKLDYTLLDEIQEAVSIAYLKDIEGRVLRRDDIKDRVKRIYCTVINNKIRYIEKH